MSRPSSAHAQRGFTIIEVMVAIVLLAVGVLGVLAMVDGANATTVRTKAREGANNVARSIVEVGRAVPYRDLSDTGLMSALSSRAGLSDSDAGSAYGIASRGTTYTVSLEVCSMDDPKDGLGNQDGSTPFCAESQVSSTPLDPDDLNPDDYKRIRVTLTWKRGSTSTTESVKQTSLISNPVGGLGPSITKLLPSGCAANPCVWSSDASIPFSAETSVNAESLSWYVKGDLQGQGTEGTSARSWSFTWNINSPTRFYDCTYLVQAQATDANGRSGAPGAVTLVLNRAVPDMPAGFEGGRNGSGNTVDLTWLPNPECDVLGYRVYRTTNGGATSTQVTCDGQAGSYTTSTSCVDVNAPASGSLEYRVVAVDTATSGATREGTASAWLATPAGNNVPAEPAGVTACLGGSPGCLEPDGTPASDGVTVVRWLPSIDSDGDAIAFYRIYRDGTSYGDRVGQFYPFGTDGLAWTDPDSPDGSHTYRVTAVDNRYGESALSTPVGPFP